MWTCLACYYTYDPSIGDLDSGIEPGTPFEDLPDDWVCPVCGVGKDQFELKERKEVVMTKMNKALNEQINKEIYSGYLYLSMVPYFEDRSLDGFASWLKAQAQEELFHAMKIFNFVHEVGGIVVLDAIEKPDIEWKSPLQVFQEGLEHEKFITASINELVDLAYEEKNWPALDMLQWFVAEQVEEEANFSQQVDQLELVGDKGNALLMMNNKMAERVPLPLSTDEMVEEE